MKAEYDFSNGVRGKFYRPKRTIIFDLGSGTTIKNNKHIAIEITDKIKALDSGKYKIIFKLQLFTKETIDYLEPLKHKVFDFVYRYCISHGYECTASIFDKESLDFLKKYETPFIKVACRDWLYKYVIDIKKPLVSVPSIVKGSAVKCLNPNAEILYCIPEYPASINKYKSLFGDLKGKIGVNISDHTTNIKLFTNHEPLIWEKHLILEHDNSDPYGDSFAAVPEDFEGVL